MLFNLIIMAEPTERRSMCLRKPKIHFDDQIEESLGPSKHFRAPKAPTKPTEPAAQPTITTTKPSASTTQLIVQQEEAEIEVFKANIKRPGQVWSGCSYCDVPLCKTSSCFKDWHSQKG